MFVGLESVGYVYPAGNIAGSQAVSDISLSVKPGDFIALIGPTGSGKSTLAQIISGLIRPTRGRVIFDSRDIWLDIRQLPMRRRLVGMVFQEPEKQLFEATIEDDVAFWPRNCGVKSGAIPGMVREALEAVGLDYNSLRGRSPFTLSGGEMRRVAIAGVLVMKPRVLILDEPTAGLDGKGRTGIMEKIKALNKNGTTIIMISHNMDEVAELADRVIVMAQGCIVFDGPPKDIFNKTELLYGIGLEPPQMARIAAHLQKKGLLGGRLPLTLDDVEQSIMAALESSQV